MYKITLISLGFISLVGCQSQPNRPIEQPKIVPQPEVTKPQEIHTPTGVVIRPYDREEIQRQQIPITTPKQNTEQRIVIPQQKKEQQPSNDGSQLPAFKSLIQQAEIALKQNQTARAETLTLQAQRLAPQAAQTYLILAKIALAKNNKTNAQSLAQRGLSLTQDENLKKQLNQILQQLK